MEIDAVIDAVRNYLDDEGYRYEYNAEHKFLRLGFGVHCKLKNVRLFVEFKKIGYVVYAIAPINADKENLFEMLKYLTMANYSLLHGNFEMDVSDGEIRYKCWIETWQLDTLGGQQIDESLSVPLMMFERYGDGIAALALGFSDAETEINKAEAPDPDEEEDEAAGPEDGED